MLYDPAEKEIGRYLCLILTYTLLTSEYWLLNSCL